MKSQYRLVAIEMNRMCGRSDIAWQTQRDSVMSRAERSAMYATLIQI